MEAGRLRHRVTIQRRLESRDTYGGRQETWSDVAEVWAEVAPLVGREYMEGRQEGAEITTKIRIRYRREIGPEMRVMWDDPQAHDKRYYDIESVQHVETKQREIVLMCRERV